MKEKGIKNPFGDSDDIGQQEMEGTSKKPLRSPSEQEEYIKNELAKSGINEDTLKFGLNMGKQLVKNSRFIDFFSLDGLKPYFDIDNQYVLKKLTYIFVPFLKGKNNNSISSNDSMQQSLQSKTTNVERFDLYLPLMSFITYVLIISFNIALNNAEIFGPQILGKILSKDFSLYIINALVLKSIMFVFLKNSLSFLDIVSLVGYKFIPITLFIEIFILLREGTLRHIVFGIICVFSVLFVRRCLNKKLAEENFKKTTIYITIALEIFTLFIVILDIPYYVHSDSPSTPINNVNVVPPSNNQNNSQQ